ncbi:MAG: hypothetical protein ACOC16_00945 [Nanoarchaeota archaeon]
MMKIHPFSKKINREYRELARKLHDKKFYENINNLLKKNGYIYSQESDTQIFFNQPFFFGNSVSKYLQTLVDKTNNLFSEIYPLILYGKNNNYLKFLDYQRQALDYIRNNNPAQIFRIDGGILKDSKKLIFMELNTNNPGGIYNIDGIERILFQEDPALDELKQKYNLKLYDRMDALSDSMIKYFENYQRRVGKNLEDKFLILGDRSGEQIPYNQLKSYLSSKGLDVSIVMNDDPELLYNHKGVFYQGKKVGFVNRRIKSNELIKKVSFLINASKLGQVCIFNSFSSGVLGVKKLYILLNDKEFQSKLSSESQSFIKDYIPETYDFLDFIRNDKFNELKNSKNKWVLKPNSGEQGIGVIIGSDISQTEWERELKKLKRDNKKLKSGRIILQSHLNLTRINDCTYDYNLLSFEGIFFPFGRVAKDKNSKTNIAQGGSYIPSFRYTQK